MAETSQTLNPCQIEIEYEPVLDVGVTSMDASTQTPFKIKQIEYGELTQLVEGATNGEYLIVTNYKDGVVIGQERIILSERIIKLDSGMSSTTLLAEAAAVKQLVGYITYNPTIETNTTHRVSVYTQLTKQDDESYRVNAKATDTMAVVVGIIASMVSMYITKNIEMDRVREIATNIVATLGGSILGGAIGVIVSENISVKAYYYTTQGCDYETGRYTPGYDGRALHVLTRDSTYSGQWFYEGFPPTNWQDNNLAIMIWNALFIEVYPNVKSYVSV